MTAKVLDTYAHRIGRRTWQAVLTQQGLDAVRSRLTKSARKSTAVACHRVRGNRRTELIWIVGNRRRFAFDGRVPVHRTERDFLKEHWENDWYHLPLLRAIVETAALWHDFGKAWAPFQTMLRSASNQNPKKIKFDPIRHEWISLLLFLGFVDSRSDQEWIGEFSSLEHLKAPARRKLSMQWIEQASRSFASNFYPFDHLQSNLTTWIAYLILSHHRLPSEPLLTDPNISVDRNNLLGRLCFNSGYLKRDITLPPRSQLFKSFKTLPIESNEWCASAGKAANLLNTTMHLHEQWSPQDPPAWERILITLGRACLMLGDHEFSSRFEDPQWNSKSTAYANTHRRDRRDPSDGRLIAAKGSLRQKLDEHCVGVTKLTGQIANLLPAIETELPRAVNIRAIRKPSPRRFEWQNRSVERIRRFLRDHPKYDGGFFGVNMASTGTGKTFANAKIMDALSPDGLRYSLALGLRTLTLQTGDEYRQRLRIDSPELAVLVGSAAVMQLHQSRGPEPVVLAVDDANSASTFEAAGCESALSDSDGLEFMTDDVLPSQLFETKISDPKRRKLLVSPVLVCTIDHLMPSVESTRGGAQIIPLMRLMSSDLVIDEVDDFDHADLPAVARLAHTVGMGGRKLVISSATIPPAIANGLFQAYKAGYEIFASFRNRRPAMAVAWFDEHSTPIVSNESENFEVLHTTFASKRSDKLAKQKIIKRSLAVRQMTPTAPTTETEDDADDKRSRQDAWQSELIDAACLLHRHHHQVDRHSGKRVSIGVIRLANVDPCISMATQFCTAELPDGFDARVICYHARQVLMIRSEVESHLDGVLRRGDQRNPFDDPILRAHLDECEADDLMFVVVATPVVEVGRDHDYDWAVVEPSSVRSLIQIGGRVLRHRDREVSIELPNLIVPQYNRRGYIGGETTVFNRPGYEGTILSGIEGWILNSKKASDLLDTNALLQRLDATPRLQQPPSTVSPTKTLAALEHAVMAKILTRPDHRPPFNHGWIHCDYYLTTLSQDASRFRSSRPDTVFHLHLIERENIEFWQADPRTRRSVYPRGTPASQITVGADPNSRRVWLKHDYQDLMRKIANRFDLSLWSAGDRFGEICVTDDDGKVQFQWTPFSGARRIER